MSQPDDIGTRFRERRIALGLTQRELAGALGVTQPQVARWERVAYRTAALASVASVAKVLGLELQAFGRGGESLAAEALASYDATLPGADPAALRAVARTGVDVEALAALCNTLGITELALFGSLLSGDFDNDSDIDLLVTYSREARVNGSFGSLLDAERVFRGLFHRPVDLVDRGALERSRNYLRRQRILEGARTIYVAG